MVVHPALSGIGERAPQTAIAGARDAGSARIILLTDAANTPAPRLNGRTGFARSQMIIVPIETLTTR
jgi:hypothetical protein